MTRKVDKITDEIERVRDSFEEELLNFNEFESSYDICVAKIKLCDQFLSYIDSLERRKSVSK